MKGTLLLLGGTADGRRLAESLSRQGVQLIYSIAGLVRTPNVSCEVFSGGYTQVGGLDRFLCEQNISAILDVTHPYARKMSETARESAAFTGIPYWRFQRPAWRPQKEDNWSRFSDWFELLDSVSTKKSLFLTAGQPDQGILERLAEYQQQGQRQLLRTAVEPRFPLPGDMEWVKAIGPFEVANERNLMRQHGIDAVISKNSGGDATVAKLQAARELNIPVYMLERPELTPVDDEFNNIAAMESFVLEQFKTLSATGRFSRAVTNRE
ncbi:precorrin-6A/cobalt-precorrin-6A reductase [Hahella ganghwensis]|uniref:precorrin-6A/cobalt-precorrin-6A reductase n=1 Tax=Hahella ganghwensis TaxID=286420 RepID=UPI00035E43CE|nr:precorrin-6A/cobalt-precorrin-6A reductase [Hahella ganghwensis]